MCGIVACCGSDNIPQLLLNGLAHLEYRGYDSAGIAVIDNEEGRLRVVKRLRQSDRGMIDLLREAAAAEGIDEAISARAGIGHTRWATHGAPSVANAHPHLDCEGRIAVVHNGIIENHARLKAELVEEGHCFKSQTDTEVVIHLLEKYYDQADGDLVESVRRTVAQLSGSFALAILHLGHPDTIVVTRNDSPLVLGSYEYGSIAASDTPAIIGYTRDVSYLGNRDLAVLHGDGQIECYDPAGELYVPNIYHIEWDIEEAEKGGYPDFMLKEIFEQPQVVQNTLAGRFDAQAQRLQFDELPLSPADIAAIERVYIVACGTSYHAGLIAKNMIENAARLPVEVQVASEFRYHNPIINGNTLVIAITQSGETADTLEAVRMARQTGAHVIAVTNVVGSRITAEAQTSLFVKANIEIAVAATKSFLAQLVLLSLLALYLAQELGLLTKRKISKYYNEMCQLPAQIESLLAEESVSAVKAAAEACVHAHTALFIGRGVGASTCYEGALKLKEISYLHAEALSAGEIKHGTIALIDPDQGTPVVAVALQSATYDKMLANIQEVKARGARVIALATEGDEQITELVDHVVWLPPVREIISPITASVVLQLFARHIAVCLGRDVDQPRNLAKSVTVE
ncbi:MAG: glutamine--fructose-6-phosphate transaminase (isomerizing) [Actinomycetia bacterium]|nr:glutamine--fructose-6-phosphate transaminase (isomerizing) [Actinomycetes bacterium]